jgi:hypothetical protein
MTCGVSPYIPALQFNTTSLHWGEDGFLTDVTSGFTQAPKENSGTVFRKSRDHFLPNPMQSVDGRTI